MFVPVVVHALLAICPSPPTDDARTFPQGQASGFEFVDGGLRLGADAGVVVDAGAPSVRGVFTSRVFDLGVPRGLRALHVVTPAPAGRPLPSGGQRDPATLGGIDMSGNALLFPFDEGVGATTVADRSGGAHVGVHDGGLSFGVPGVSNAALSNDSGCVFVPSAPTLHPGNQLTIAAWVFPRGLDGVTPHGLVAKRADYLVQSEYALFLWLGDHLWVDLDTEDDRFSGNAVIQNERWTHVALVYDGRLDAGVRVRLFVDGQLDVVGHETSASLAPQDVPVAVGCLPNPGGGALQPFAGELDEVAVWHRAFSDAEVAALHARGVTRHQLGLRTCTDALCASDGPFLAVEPGVPFTTPAARFAQYRLEALAPTTLLDWSTVTSVSLELDCADGGVDAGAEGRDAGDVDAGVVVDAGVDSGKFFDGGVVDVDAGAVSEPRQLRVGFGCNAAPMASLLLAALLLSRRRR